MIADGDHPEAARAQFAGFAFISPVASIAPLESLSRGMTVGTVAPAIAMRSKPVKFRPR